MVLRVAEGLLHGTWVGVDYRWVDLEKVSLNLLAAVLASEDARCFRHHGLDFVEIERARESTTTGNTDGAFAVPARSACGARAARSFLWTGRNWVHKGLECHFTGLPRAAVE